MTLLVPEKTTGANFAESFSDLSALLTSAQEFIGASAGWIGLPDACAGWTFPARAGALTDNWLLCQPARSAAWSFTVGREPILLNDLPPSDNLDDPPLHNLLSCPLLHDDRLLGHVALANKAHGFVAQDAAVLQGLAHHMVRLLVRRPASPPLQLSAAWRRILDRASEAILVLDPSGVLLFANAAWLDWTSFRAEELLGHSPPFSVWVNQHELARALSATPPGASGVLPFRRRDSSLLWCRMETATERWNGHTVTLAFLLQTEAQSPPLEKEKLEEVVEQMQPEPIPLASPTSLPLLLDLEGGIDGWGPRWEETTGLSAADVEGSRSELVLDWLFPQQHDRERVADCFHHPSSTGCQLVLDIATATGSQPVSCTFLPLPSGASAVARRWLLLVGETKTPSAPPPSLELPPDPVGSAVLLDGVIRLDPASAPHRPHPLGERTSPATIIPPKT
jgi:PAS domain S-box-containing protein